MAPSPEAIRGFLKRLSMYSFGIAIGLIFMALIQVAKHRSNANASVQSPPDGTVEAAPGLAENALTAEPLPAP